MDCDSLVSEISDKFGYDEELQIAIKLVLPIMVKKYGEERIDEICDLFRTTKIFSTNDMSQKSRKEIEESMLSGINNHVVEIEAENSYQTNDEPGAYYSYQSVYNMDMNIIGEVRWLVINDMKSKCNGDRYKELFGTSINIPYFIHELNHAFAMDRPAYRKEGNKIYLKHGLFEEQFSFEHKDGKVVLKTVATNGIIIEEMINEKITQDMLVELMQVRDYGAVKEILKSIGHISSAYSSVLISLAEKLETALGQQALLNWRKYNDMSVKEDFNRSASQSDIAKKIRSSKKPYDYLCEICFKLFSLKCNGYKMSIEQYAQQTKLLMLLALMPIEAYRDIKNGTVNLGKFEQLCTDILGTSIESMKEDPMVEGSKIF